MAQAHGESEDDWSSAEKDDDDKEKVTRDSSVRTKHETGNATTT
jgi:hypothetical protein